MGPSTNADDAHDILVHLAQIGTKYELAKTTGCVILSGQDQSSRESSASNLLLVAPTPCMYRYSSANMPRAIRQSFHASKQEGEVHRRSENYFERQLAIHLPRGVLRCTQYLVTIDE